MNNLHIEREIVSRLLEVVDKSRIARVNANYKPPSSGVWVRVSVLGGINIMSGMADTPTTREVGTVIVQIFDRKGVGTTGVKQTADSIGKHLSYFKQDKLELLTASLSYVGGDDGFVQYNISVPYRYG